MKADAILVDVDGTVALKGDRGRFDEARVLVDLPNPPVITAVRAMHAAGYRVVFMSGRSEGCREDTEKWLTEHVSVPFDALYMRSDGDYRKDAIVKKELFDRHVCDKYQILAVFDDRNQVVDMWRSIGLTVFQVAEGNF